MLVLMMLVLLGAAGGGAAWWFLGRAHVEPDAKAAPIKPPLFHTLEPFTVNLAENLKRLGLTPDLLLPLHGRIVPVADLNKAVGHEH